MQAAPPRIRSRRPAQRSSLALGGFAAAKVSQSEAESITHSEWLTRAGNPPAPGAVLPQIMHIVRKETAEDVEIDFSAGIKSPALAPTKMVAPAPAKIYGGRWEDIWINPPHVDEKSLPGWQDFVSGPGDAEARWLRFRKANPRINADITNANRLIQRRDYDSGTEWREEYLDQQANKKAVRSRYGGIILDTYYAWRAITVARYHAEHDARIKKWKIGIAAIAVGAVAATFLGPGAAGATQQAAATTGVGGAGAAGTGAAALTPITVAAKPLAIKAATALAPAILKPIATSAPAAVSAVEVVSGIKKAIPQVVDTVNNVRTIKAIVDGEVPPPPISLDGSNFKDYAVSVGNALLEEKLRKEQAKLTAAQEAAMQRDLEQQIALIQARAGQILPPGSPMYPVGQLAPQVIQAQSEQRGIDDWVKIGGAALLTVLMLGG